ncbi:MAG: hypothetical protein R3F39_14040 [Myxococcota bacterium]
MFSSIHRVWAALALGCLAAAPACDGGGADKDGEDATPGFVGFLLQPETVSLLPGECSVASLTWSGTPELTADQVEWEAPKSLRITPVGGNGFQFCAGYEVGEGDINVRLVGQGEFKNAGRGFVRELGPNDDRDPFEPTWIRGRSKAPTRVFWSADGKRIYSTSVSQGGLEVRNAQTLAMETVHFIHSEDAAPLDEDRIAVGQGSATLGVYSLSERRLRTAFYGITFQPGIVGGDLPFVGAGDGIIGAISRNGNNNACTVSTVDLERNKHTIVATSNGLGFVPQSGVTGAGWQRETGSGPPTESWMELSRSGRYALLGPRGCWTSGTTLVDLETEKTTLNCMPPRNVKFDHRPVISADGSTIASFVNTGPNGQGYVGLGIADTDGCKPRGSAPGGGQHGGLAIANDGSKVATLVTTKHDDATGTDEVELRVTDSSPAAFAAPGGPKTVSTTIGARFRPDSDLIYRNHRLAFSPDGGRIALAFVGGRFGMYDVATQEVTLEAPMDWGSAQPTPNARYVMAKLHDGEEQHGWALVDTESQQVVRVHGDVDQLEGVFEGGYVLSDFAKQNITFYDYESGTPEPFTGDLDAAFDAYRTASDDGTATCTVNGTEACIGAKCANVKALTDGRALQGQTCVMMDSQTAIFVFQYSMWRWNGTSPTAVHMSQSYGDGGGAEGATRLMRLRDREIMLRNRTHLIYWKL